MFEKFKEDMMEQIARPLRNNGQNKVDLGKSPLLAK